LDEKSRSKQRDHETKAEVLTKEVDIIRRKADMLEKENKYLRDQTSSRERVEKSTALIKREDETEEFRCSIRASRKRGSKTAI
jgi:hypothetical protein